MRKRALRKKIGELEALLEDRREALGELVLGMHVQQSWDEDLMARGAAEVREVEDELKALREELDGGSAPSREPDEAPGDSTTSPGDGPEQPTFETAEHTTEHALPTEGGEPKSSSEADEPPSGEASTADPDRGQAPSLPPGTPAVPLAADTAKGGDEPDAPEDVEPVSGEQARDRDSEQASGSEVGERDVEKESAPSKQDSDRRPEPVEEPSGKSGSGVPQSGAESPSPLDRLAERLDSEERDARTGVEAARAAARADARTETSAILESVERERAGLKTALTAAAARIQAAEKRADDAEAEVARKEAENREAAAGWVRSQAAEIEADAALASEMAVSGTPAGSPAVASSALEAEIASLKAEVEAERGQKVAAIAAAEAKLREIESKAREAEARLTEVADTGSDAPSAAETREAAVDWLRGQIAALKNEIEASTNRPGD